MLTEMIYHKTLFTILTYQFVIAISSDVIKAVLAIFSLKLSILGHVVETTSEQLRTTIGLFISFSPHQPQLPLVPGSLMYELLNYRDQITSTRGHHRLPDQAHGGSRSINYTLIGLSTNVTCQSSVLMLLPPSIFFPDQRHCTGSQS